MCQSVTQKCQEIYKAFVGIGHSFKMENFLGNGDTFWRGTSWSWFSFGRDLKILGANPTIPS